jgi:hypothetical protein
VRSNLYGKQAVPDPFPLIWGHDVKRIYSSSDSAQLGLLANRLQAAGIECEVRSESQIIPGIPFGPELWVLNDQDFDEASELISAWQSPVQSTDSEASADQSWEEVVQGDSRTVDSIVAALYRAISGPAGVERDWDRFRALFHPQARLMRTVKHAEGELELSVMDVEAFIEFATPYFRSNPFYERELFRKLDQFGQIAQVFSTFSSSSDPAGRESTGAGINSVQLWCDGERWWVLNMVWDEERPGNAIPAAYLPP